MGSIQPFRSLLLLFIRESHVAATPHQHEVQLSTRLQIIPTSHVLCPFPSCFHHFWHLGEKLL